jgi:nicotinate-nucleotide--dimethylbenzimidazole phosphoribosyltransferase
MRDQSEAGSLIEDTRARITPLNSQSHAAALSRQSNLTKPPGSLGRLEQLSAEIAAMTGNPRPRLANRLVIVAAGDHGVAKKTVSAYPAEVTGQMVENFLNGGAAINVLANHAEARVRVIDAGVASPTAHTPALLKLNLGLGTNDITEGPAMSRATAEHAVAAGISLFEEELAGSGIDIVACGEMGIGNTTSAAAIVSAATGRPPASVTGRGTGVGNQVHATKVRAVETALAVNRPDPQDGIGLLAAVGGFEIGVLTGVYLGAASRRVPAVMDGLISSAAALVAVALEPQVHDYLIASHRSSEPGHRATLEMLELEPLLDLGLRLGEGSGAALGITLCVAACRLLDEMATFSEAGVTDSDKVTEPER